MAPRVKTGCYDRPASPSDAARPRCRVHPTLVAELAGRESAATAVGLCLAVASLGVIAGAPLVGAVADWLGTYGPGWVGLAGAMGLAVALPLGAQEPAGRGWQ